MQALQSILAQLPLSSILALLLGVLPGVAGYVAAYVAGYLRSDNYNRYINAAIAGGVILIFAGLSIIIADAVSGQWAFSLQAVQASVVILAFGQMKPLMLDVQDVVGFTSQGFVLLPQKDLGKQVATDAATGAVAQAIQAQAQMRTSNAVQPVQKVNLTPIVPPTTDHAG